MRLLNTIATPRNSDNKKLQQGGPVLQTSTNGAGTVDLDTSGDVVKAEDIANEPTVINDHIDPSVAISEEQLKHILIQKPFLAPLLLRSLKH
ncbi:hypothetical protein ERJ75_001254700 [Trypanosoma vivax]|nr:hypothetical protein ERJ75_001254700 [Trypanosoma vivax]